MTNTTVTDGGKPVKWKPENPCKPPSAVLDRPAKINVSFRASSQDLRAINQLAKQHGLTRTDFLIGSALGRLEDPSLINQRLQTITDRLDRLEQVTYGT